MKFCVILLFLLFCLKARVLNSQNLTCNPNDMKVLKDFLNGLESGIDGWDMNGSSSPNCCTWSGITCFSSLSLQLHDATISGRIVKLEISWKRLYGELPASLGSLDQLRTLNLSNNFLKGSLPASLLHLPHLEFLDMRNNDLSGFLPQSINLPSIQVIDISGNYFEGSIPVGICKNSTRISVINVGVNYFSGSVSPGIGNCSSLIDLYLDANYLSGGLPEDLFMLKGLATLALHDNNLSGQLPNRVDSLVLFLDG